LPAKLMLQVRKGVTRQQWGGRGEGSRGGGAGVVKGSRFSARCLALTDPKVRGEYARLLNV